MKTTTKLLAGAVAVAIGGLTMTGMVSADTTVIHDPDAGITYTLNAGYPTEQTFTAGTITISDTETTITILDRNLGATAAGTGCEDPTYPYEDCNNGDDTYGYHFQWGNNYGFKGTGSVTVQNGQVPSNIVNPGYTNWVFYAGYDNWVDSNEKVNLWGGSTDDYISSLNGDNWKVNSEQVAQRRGPCPENFHVPSYGELLKIKNMMGNSESAIHSQLLVPFVGRRSYYAAEVYGLGGYAYLRSSSPASTKYPYSRFLHLGVDGSLGMDDFNRADADSLRCVYDSYETYTPSGNLPSEGGDGSGGNSKIIVSIAALNSGQNTCSGEDFIFPAITAKPSQQVITLAKRFQCIFGNSASKAVTLALSGDLTDENGNVISGENVRLKNPEWTSQPTVLKNGSTAFNFKTFMGLGATLFNKVGNKIGTAEGSGVEIEITVPGGTPDGTYNGILVLTY